MEFGHKKIGHRAEMTTSITPSPTYACICGAKIYIEWWWVGK